MLEIQKFSNLPHRPVAVSVEGERAAGSKNKLVRKTFAMLRSFKGRDEWLTSLELSQRAHLPKASGHRLVQTLEELGAIVRGPNGRYRLGMIFVSLYRNVAIDELLRAAAAPVLQEFSSSLGLTLHMGILEGGMVTYICKLAAKAGFPSHTKVNAQHEAYCSALGKVLLGGLSTDSLESFLHDGEFVPLTPCTITDRSVLRAEVENARLLGYAIDHEESSLGLCCVAVPVCDADGGIIAAISASGDPTQMSGDKLEEAKDTLWTAAKVIGQKLGPLPDLS